MVFFPGVSIPRVSISGLQVLRGSIYQGHRPTGTSILGIDTSGLQCIFQGPIFQRPLSRGLSRVLDSEDPSVPGVCIPGIYCTNIFHGHRLQTSLFYGSSFQGLIFKRSRLPICQEFLFLVSLFQGSINQGSMFHGHIFQGFIVADKGNGGQPACPEQ